MRLEVGSESVTKFPTKRSALILARLALAKGQSIGRDELAEQLWPDEILDTTRIRLRQEIRRLRLSVGELGDHIRADRQVIEIEPGYLTSDIQVFDQNLIEALGTGDAQSKILFLSQAVDCLTGSFMAGYQEPWVLANRRDYEDKARRAWLALAGAFESLKLEEDALRATLNAVRQAPLDLESNTSLIRRLFDQGQTAQAKQAYFDFDAMMFRELGQHPPYSVQSALRDAIPARARNSISSEPVLRGSVQRPLPIYGREELLKSIESAISRPQAAVALIGTIGVGKTHLVKETAWRFSQSDGIPIQFGGNIGSVDDGLYILDSQVQPSEILSNVKLATERGWRVLATSRIYLNDERVTEILVNPLPIPSFADDDSSTDPNPATKVLLSKILDRGLTHPATKEMAQLDAIAYDLGGLPSCLKFFAARLAIQTAFEVHRSLDRGIEEFMNSPSTESETVYSAASRIVGELPINSQKLLYALSLLENFSKELAARIVSKYAGYSNSVEIWDSIESRCLITRHGSDSQIRFRVPVHIAFAIQKIPLAIDRGEVAERCWRFVADWAYEKSRGTTRENQEFAFDAICSELPNLKIGIAWATGKDPILACLFVIAMWRTIYSRCDPTQYSDLILAAARSGSGSVGAEMLGEAWMGAGNIQVVAGRLDAAEEAFLEAIRTYAAVNHRNGLAWAYGNYAIRVLSITSPAESVEMARLSSEMTTEGSVRRMTLSYCAGKLADEGNVQEAFRIGEQIFAEQVQSNDMTAQARSYTILADLYIRVDRVEAARPMLLEGIRRLRETGVQEYLFEALVTFATISMATDDLTDLLREAKALATRMGSNARLLQVARLELEWHSRRTDLAAMRVAVEDMFRFTQLSDSAKEREKSLRTLAVELDRQHRSEYGNAIRAALGEVTEGPINAGWRAVLSSEVHTTVCVLSVAMAKEAIADRGATV